MARSPAPPPSPNSRLDHLHQRLVASGQQPNYYSLLLMDLQVTKSMWHRATYTYNAIDYTLLWVIHPANPLTI